MADTTLRTSQLRLPFHALDWAWNLDLKPTLKLIAVALAMFVNSQSGEAWPSVTTLADMTGLNRKTISAGLVELTKLGELADTGRRQGRTQQVKVYRLPRFHAPKHPESVQEASVSAPQSVHSDWSQTMNGTMEQEKERASAPPLVPSSQPQQPEQPALTKQPVQPSHPFHLVTPVTSTSRSHGVPAEFRERLQRSRAALANQAASRRLPASTSLNLH